MEVPYYAGRAESAYKRNGTLPGANTYTNLDKPTLDNSLKQMKDEFRHWQSLDETPADLLKGQPGAVRVAGPAENEYSEAEFSGDTTRGQIQIDESEPSHHYGSSSFTHIIFRPEAAEQLSVVQLSNDSDQTITELVHVDHQISSEGPIVLGGSSTTVTLKDHALGGFLVTPLEK